MSATAGKKLLKVALCDDDFVVETQIRAFLEKEEKDRKGEAGFLLTVKKSGEELLSDFRPGLYDLLLLDILMGGMNGVETLTKLREKDNSLICAFITSSRDFALDGYRLGVVRYLEKPMTREGLSELIDFALSEKGKLPSLTVRPRGMTESVALSDIEYFCQNGHTTELHLSNGEVISFTGKLDEIEEDLRAASGTESNDTKVSGDGFCFIRCHKSFIVNLYFVDEADPEFCVFRMRSGDSAHIRREDFSAARNAFKAVSAHIAD